MQKLRWNHRERMKHISKCYVNVICWGAEQGWKLTVQRLRAHGCLQRAAPALCHIAVTSRGSACRSSLLLPLRRTLASEQRFCIHLTQWHRQCFGGRLSLSPCKAPGAAVPPSVRSSASSQHCRGSGSSRKLCLPSFCTGVSQALIFTSSVLLDKPACSPGKEAKINRGIPSTLISSFYLKSTSNNLVVKLLKYNAMYYLKYSTNSSYDFELHLLLSGRLAPCSDVWRNQTTNQAGVSSARWWELI